MNTQRFLKKLRCFKYWYNRIPAYEKKKEHRYLIIRFMLTMLIMFVVDILFMIGGIRVSLLTCFITAIVLAIIEYIYWIFTYN